ncbi:hypothetical protein D3272_17605 [Lichenibacterium ramalinae]|uniref:Uncharacterized protein n=1 Tax=Lichenibacterium ramalinae TaxID=2316527 RepID=A0A4Q2RBW0_9HYPH|nr:hypothetical protein D3272_17605 [Lichenibacterium ramalinae]
MLARFAGPERHVDRVIIVTGVDAPVHQAADDFERVAPDLVLCFEVEILAKTSGYKRKIDKIDIGFVPQLGDRAFYGFFDHGKPQ